MKQSILPLVLIVSTVIYLHNLSAQSGSALKNQIVGNARSQVAVPEPIIAPGPATYSRWKTGPTAQNDWKTGPNAQTNFEPFSPNEQADWNQSSGYTIISGARIRR